MGRFPKGRESVKSASFSNHLDAIMAASEGRSCDGSKPSP